MATRSVSSSRFVICIDNSEYPASLELHKVYRVVANKAAEHDRDLRIVDESGEDYLYPARYFISVESPKAVERTLKRGARTVSKRRQARST